VIVVASALAFIPRTVRQFRNGHEDLEAATEPTVVLAASG
jgi:hypothetical protein